MIGMEEFPLELALGKDVARLFQKEHQENGVVLHMQKGVKEITADGDGKATGVVLSDDACVEGDLIIVGTGIAPATKWLSRTENGIKVDKFGGILVDPFL